MKYTVNGTAIQYESANEAAWGSNDTLLDHATDLTRDTSWHDAGFLITEFLETQADAADFNARCRELIKTCWRQSGLNVPSDFEVSKYHEIVHSQAEHLAAVEQTKLLTIDRFPLDIEVVTRRVSELCGRKVIARNPFDGQSVFHFRVIRPDRQDNNPLHRDVWLEDYDDCINLYIPVAGSDERSSLILFPGSHLWPESRIEKTKGGARIGAVQFNVPAVTDIRGEFHVVRPDPGFNQFLLFSPYLIHGGAVNLNKDATRISIEMRLWAR